MVQPFIERLRRARLFLRSVAITVVCAYLGLYLQPVALAARLPAASASTTAKTPATPEEKLNRTLEDIEDQLSQLETRLNQRADATTEKTRLKAMRQELDALDKQARASFNTIERHLKDKKLPQVILDRHIEAVRTYRSEMAILKSNLDSLEIAKDDAERKTRAQKAREHLKAKQKKKAHTPVDPNNLPFRVPDAKKTRKPAKKKEDFQRLGLLQEERIQLASTELLPGMLTAAAALALPAPADLQSTEDVQITPEIQALAESLNKNPVKIYNWVHDNIRFLPTYGSIQGSQMTLMAQQGNAFDTASLLIALLRASGIPARYVYGTIRIPADQAMNWVGGVTKPEAAQQLLGQGGIPNTALVSGGKIVAIELEHVWVEAWVDFFPSRGAVHKQGDTWVPLDGSFKQYQYTQGMDIKTNVPFDAAAFLNQVQAGATINQSESWVTGIDQNVAQNAIINYQSDVQAYIETIKPGATIGDVLGIDRIIASTQSVLAADLPYVRIATGSRFPAIPDTLHAKIRLTIYGSPIEKALGSPMLMFDRNLSSLAGKKIALIYEPSSEADQAVINSAVANGSTSLPAYLIQVKPVLRLESETVATGLVVPMAEQHTLEIVVTTPWYSQERDYKITAGDLSVIGINPAGITLNAFKARTSLFDVTNNQLPDFSVHEVLYQVILGWWLQHESFSNILGKMDQVKSYQLPSHGLIAAPLTVQYTFGIPTSASYKSRTLDVKENFLMVEHQDDGVTLKREFMLRTGKLDSYLEGGIFEMAFPAEGARSISSISLIQEANAEHVPIYTITGNNINQVIPVLQIDQEVALEITGATLAGKKILVPKQNITHSGYTGVGYIIEDPETGSAVYQISGGRSGGEAGSSGGPVPDSTAPQILLLGVIAQSLTADAAFGALLGDIFGMLISPAAIAIALGVILVVIAYIVASWIILAIEFRQEVIDKAKENPLARDLPENNCRVVAVQITPPNTELGWARCTYTCRLSGNFHPRHLPIELACPSPVPCAPGLLWPPGPRAIGDPIDPSVAVCIFR